MSRIANAFARIMLVDITNPFEHAVHHLQAYADALLVRFENSALNHRLSQISMDGSQKIPQRWLETLAWNRERDRTCPSIYSALTAWFEHVKGASGPVDDPRSQELAAANLTDDMWTNLAKIFGPEQAAAG